MDAETTHQDRNHVELVGRVSSEPVLRTMPSGDELLTFNLVVRRPAGHDTRQSVDTIECAAWTARTRRSVARLREDDTVCVIGALRRRFQRTGGSPQSRYTVELSACRRVGRRQ